MSIKRLDNPVRVAVYGSLRQGFGNNRLLEGVKLLGTTRSTAEYKMISLGGFPGVKKEGNTSIVLEIYETDDPTVLKRLDWLEGFKEEGHPYNMYIIYTYNSDISDKDNIESGDWKKYKNNKVI